MCRCMCNACICKKGPVVNLGCYSSRTNHLGFWHRISLWYFGFSKQVRLAGQWTQGIHLARSPQIWDYKYVPSCLSFCMGSRFHGCHSSSLLAEPSSKSKLMFLRKQFSICKENFLPSKEVITLPIFFFLQRHGVNLGPNKVHEGLSVISCFLEHGWQHSLHFFQVLSSAVEVSFMRFY